MATFLTNSEFTRLATEERIMKTMRALEAHSIRVVVFETSEEARTYVLDLLPSGADVYNSPSRMLEQLGLADAIEHSARFQSVRAQVHALDRLTQRIEMRKVRASPDVLVGSVHAITEQGEIMIASATGGQLGPAASGAGMVIWVVGTQKLVHTLSDGLRRIRDYCLPLESERVQQVYGQGQASAINKLLKRTLAYVQGLMSPVERKNGIWRNSPFLIGELQQLRANAEGIIPLVIPAPLKPQINLPQCIGQCVLFRKGIAL